MLYNFASYPNGVYPQGQLTADNSGNLYGTTEYGGGNGYGAVFELSPEPGSGCPSGSNTGNGWCETVLYSFCSLASCIDGSTPYYAYVTLDSLRHPLNRVY